MDEILNNLGLPNDIGFEISLKTLRSLLNRDAYDNLYLTIRKMFDKVTESIGLDESLNLGISMDFTIKFKDGQKIIAMDEYTIIQSIYKYFNTDYEYSNDVNFALEEKEKALWRGPLRRDFFCFLGRRRGREIFFCNHEFFPKGNML